MFRHISCFSSPHVQEQEWQQLPQHHSGEEQVHVVKRGSEGCPVLRSGTQVT